MGREESPIKLLAVLAELRRLGANLDGDYKGSTALHVAVQCCNAALPYLLLVGAGVGSCVLPLLLVCPF